MQSHSRRTDSSHWRSWGALLTGVVAAGLAVSGLGGDTAATGSNAVTADAGGGSATAGAPTPNANAPPGRDDERDVDASARTCDTDVVGLIRPALATTTACLLYVVLLRVAVRFGAIPGVAEGAAQ